MRRETQRKNFQLPIQLKNKLFLFLSRIRVQLIIGFIIPVFFLVFTGFFSYSAASKGMIKNYEQSTQKAIQMALQYLDIGLTFTKNQALEIVSNETMSNYSYGMYAEDKIKQSMLYTQLYYELEELAKNNSFIKNIHIITEDNINLISTAAGENTKGFYQEFINSAEGQTLFTNHTIEAWASSHTVIDKNLSLQEKDYALYYASSSNNGKACIVIDVDNKIIQDTLSKLNLGEDAILSFVTKEGKEVTVLGKDPFGFAWQEFYSGRTEVNNGSFSEYVKLNGESFLYLNCKSQLSGASINVLVPKAKVMASAYEIRFVTIVLILLSVLVSGSIGTLILVGIIRNISRITRSLALVSKGDLTVAFDCHSENEFGILSKEIMQTIANTRQVIENAQDVNSYVSDSTNQLLDNCMVLSKHSENISLAIEDINQGINQQSGDLQQCLLQMDGLSNKIVTVSEHLNKIEDIADESKDYIKKSIVSMEKLSVCSETTSKITHQVIGSNQQLETKLSQIEQFAGLINEISNQTSLLALNASIEAARAGIYGRGFTVVSQEIKKLANASLKAVDEVTKVITQIKAQSADTLSTALTAGKVVSEQEETLGDTINALNNMNECLENLLHNFYQVGTSVISMGSDREDTLSAIESISSVSEETAAASCMVNETAKEQLRYVEALKKNSVNLQSKSTELSDIIHQFKI